MFLNSRRSYDRDGGQRAAGPFLWVVLPNEPETVLCGTCKGETSRKVEDQVPYRYCSECHYTFYERIYHPPFTEARAFVRHVKMHQCGHWMMGNIKVGKHTQQISGTYGCDGLPDDAARSVWEAGVPVPVEIMDVWAKDGGHNCAGGEALSIHTWATENIKALRRAGRDL